MVKGIKVSSKSADSVKADLCVTGMFDGKSMSKDQKSLDSVCGGALSSAVELSGFDAKFGKSVQVFGNSSLKRVSVYGAGDKAEFKTDNARDLAAMIVKDAQKHEAKSITVDAGSFGLNRDAFCQAFCEGLILGAYSFNEYKSDKKEKKVTPITVTVTGNASAVMVNKALAIGDSVSLARDVSNHPANIATPTFLAKHAKRIGKAKNFKVKILDYKDCKKLGMGAFCGVAQGAKEPAKAIIMEYMGGKKGDKPFALVGKGLTFDSGGISLKPGAKMDEMKFDMCGSSTVLGVMNAIAELQPKMNVVAVIGSTENMPGSNAQRPGDIVTAYNGKTIEILNTDAEGRLLLADMLSYTVDKYKPVGMMDFATLTGAVLIALGHKSSGVMGNNDDLMKEVKKSSDNTGERVWELPMWKEYSEDIKSKIADIKNLGAPMQAGTIAGGVFLQEFVGDTPWVHMDIAGMAWGPTKPSYQPKNGATGYGVRIVYDLLENRIK